MSYTWRVTWLGGRAGVERHDQRGEAREGCLSPGALPDGFGVGFQVVELLSLEARQRCSEDMVHDRHARRPVASGVNRARSSRPATARAANSLVVRRGSTQEQGRRDGEDVSLSGRRS